MKMKKQLSFFTCNVNYGTETKSENVIAYNRVTQGSFTLTFSQNRTWKSPFIRLFMLINHIKYNSIYGYTHNQCANKLIRMPNHCSGYWLWFCLIVINHSCLGCKLFWNLTCLILRSISITETSILLRLSLPPMSHTHPFVSDSSFDLSERHRVHLFRKSAWILVPPA